MSRKGDLREAESSPDGRYVRFDERLGSGAYKEVYLSYDTETGKEVAWNTVSLTRLPESEKRRIQSETNILSQLNHPHIINFYHTWDNTEKDQICFTTEIVTSGTLKQYINRVKGVKLKVIKKWCRQILTALNYLHSHNPPIIHRDLKCDNIFINGADSSIRIGDFGLSASRATTHVESVLGTPEFMAPELYDENYSEKVDIYAFGMCVLEMCSREYPYEECSNAAQIWKRVSSGTKPAVLNRIRDNQVKSFIELCLFEQDLRLSAFELLNHPFLTPDSDPNLEASIVVVDPKPNGKHIPAPSVPVSIANNNINNNINSNNNDNRSQSPAPAISRKTSAAAPVTTVNVAPLSPIRLPITAGNGLNSNNNTVKPIAVRQPSNINQQNNNNNNQQQHQQQQQAHSVQAVVDPHRSSLITIHPVTANGSIIDNNNTAFISTVQSPTNQQSILTAMQINTSATTTAGALNINNNNNNPISPDNLTPSTTAENNTVTAIGVDVDNYTSGHSASIVLHIHFDARRHKQIKFQFDFRHDTSMGLSAEMVKALKLPDPDRTQMLIATTMESKIDPFRRMYFECCRQENTPTPSQQQSILDQLSPSTVKSILNNNNNITATAQSKPASPVFKPINNQSQINPKSNTNTNSPATQSVQLVNDSNKSININPPFDFPLFDSKLDLTQQQQQQQQQSKIDQTISGDLVAHFTIDEAPITLTGNKSRKGTRSNSPQQPIDLISSASAATEPITITETSSDPFDAILTRAKAASISTNNPDQDDPVHHSRWYNIYKVLSAAVLKQRLKAKGAESIAATCFEKHDLIEALIKLTKKDELPSGSSGTSTVPIPTNTSPLKTAASSPNIVSDHFSSLFDSNTGTIPITVTNIPNTPQQLIAATSAPATANGINTANNTNTGNNLLSTPYHPGDHRHTLSGDPMFSPSIFGSPVPTKPSVDIFSPLGNIGIDNNSIITSTGAGADGNSMKITISRAHANSVSEEPVSFRKAHMHVDLDRNSITETTSQSILSNNVSVPIPHTTTNSGVNHAASPTRRLLPIEETDFFHTRDISTASAPAGGGLDLVSTTSSSGSGGGGDGGALTGDSNLSINLTVQPAPIPANPHTFDFQIELNQDSNNNNNNRLELDTGRSDSSNGSNNNNNPNRAPDSAPIPHLRSPSLFFRQTDNLVVESSSAGGNHQNHHHHHHHTVHSNRDPSPQSAPMMQIPIDMSSPFEELTSPSNKQRILLLQQQKAQQQQQQQQQQSNSTESHKPPLIKKLSGPASLSSNSLANRSQTAKPDFFEAAARAHAENNNNNNRPPLSTSSNSGGVTSPGMTASLFTVSETGNSNSNNNSNSAFGDFDFVSSELAAAVQSSTGPVKKSHTRSNSINIMSSTDPINRSGLNIGLKPPSAAAIANMPQSTRAAPAKFTLPSVNESSAGISIPIPINIPILTESQSLTNTPIDLLEKNLMDFKL